jgi:hypothetical protein
MKCRAFRAEDQNDVAVLFERVWYDCTKLTLRDMMQPIFILVFGTLAFSFKDTIHREFLFSKPVACVAGTIGAERV